MDEDTSSSPLHEGRDEAAQLIESVAPGVVILVAAAVVLDDLGRTLVVRKRGTSAFMQPGGKIEAGETAFAALRREVLEELGVRIVSSTARPIGRFRAPAANEPDHVVDAELFLVELDGDPRPRAEIEQLAWLDPQLPCDDMPLAPLTQGVVVEYLRSGQHRQASRRSEVLRALAEHLLEMQTGHPLRVAIDGITASGKTTFADELSAELTRQGRGVVRIRMDDFHHLREHRYRQGKDSARGYYDDAYDFQSLSEHVLKPLGPEGNRRYRGAVVDLESNIPTNEPLETAAPETILVVDGSFMQRHYRDHWDCVVFVDTSFPEARRRGVERDAEQLGGKAAAEERYALRYHAASHMYVDEVDPAVAADFVIGNDDFDAPRLHRNRR